MERIGAEILKKIMENREKLKGKKRRVNKKLSTLKSKNTLGYKSKATTKKLSDNRIRTKHQDSDLVSQSELQNDKDGTSVQLLSEVGVDHLKVSQMSNKQGQSRNNLNAQSSKLQRYQTLNPIQRQGIKSRNTLS